MRWLSRALASNAARDLEVRLALIKLDTWCNTHSWFCQQSTRRNFSSLATVGTARAGHSERVTCAESACRVTALRASPRYSLTCIQHSVSRRLACSTRRLSCCSVLGNKESEKSSPSEAEEPSTAASQAAGLGALSMFGLLGKRIIMILGGKKVLFGLFSVVSLKKLLFLPGWIMVLSVSAGLSASYWAAQADAPITGRKRPLLITESQEVDIGERAWQALLHQGGREWMFSVAISSDSDIEAYSMAPGFVVVSEGLMKMCTSDAELAFILAHEVAHVVARHVSERQSRYALWGTFRQSLEQSLGISSERQVLDLLLHLPLSRELETEADEIALVLMCKACYNPEVASHVFTKMQRLKPAALDWGHHWSTHPSFETRKTRVQDHVAQVMREVPCHQQDSLHAALMSKPVAT